MCSHLFVGDHENDSSHALHGTVFAMICPHCGQPFEPKLKSQLYCRPSCRYAYRAIRKPRLPVRTVLCAKCGTSFETSKTNHRFCSDYCRSRSRNDQSEELPERPCKGCKKMFQPSTKDRKFCSVTCRNNWNKRTLIKRKEYPGGGTAVLAPSELKSARVKPMTTEEFERRLKKIRRELDDKAPLPGDKFHKLVREGVTA